MNATKINILGISGSLRQSSSNTALLQAAARLAPHNVTFTIYGGLGDLPHFNPEIDGEGTLAPAAVTALRTQLKEADGVCIVTPEYANGVPGVLKNALDWVVSSGELLKKPTAVISASPSPLGGDKAHASLLLTLAMVDAKIAEGATMLVPLVSSKINADGEITDPAIELELKKLLDALIRTIETA